MKKTPEIVKELREYEKSGKLKHKNKLKNDRSLQINEFIFNEYKDNFDKNFKSNDILEKYILNDDQDELYKILVENSTEGILLLNSNGIIVFANPAIQKIFGYNKIDDIIGKNISEIIDSNHHNKLNKDQNLIKLGKGEFINTYEAVTNTGEKIWIELLACKSDELCKSINIVFIKDITKRHKTWGELTKLGDKYKALAEMSSDGILIIDPLGRLTYLNQTFEKMCNKKKNELIGTLFRDYLTEKSVYLFQQLIMDVRTSNKKIKNIELELICNKNKKIPSEISLIPLKNNSNEFIGIACTLHDISDHKKIENELKKSERFKTEFMNIAAHELKSPITPIKGYLNLIISDKGINKNTKKWSQICLRNTNRLLKLINDILDVSRLNSDTMVFDMEKLNIIKILKEISEDMRPIIEGKNLNLIVNIPKDLPYVFGDKYRLEQVFENLLINAIKFTNDGSIKINAKKEEGKIVIEVEDSGIGIDKSDLERVFTKFYQVNTNNDRLSEGTGLGLYICKEIIKRHNGIISAESKSNKGSKFIVKIPYIR